MPLGDFEREVLRLLAANRNPDSFVAGATVRHRSPDPAAPEFAQLTSYYGSVKGDWPCIVEE